MAVTLEPDDSTNFTFTAAYEWKTYRFLISDGKTYDVRAIQDDSVLRAAVIALVGGLKIEGVARLPEPEPVVESAAKSKRPAKATG